MRALLLVALTANLVPAQDCGDDMNRRLGGAGIRRGLRGGGRASAPTMRAVLLIGQSNAAGQGLSSELTSPLSDPQPSIQIYAGGQTPVGPPWRTLQPGFGSAGGRSGPELSLGHDLASAWGEMRIIKYATGNTSLAVDWDPDTGPQYAAMVAHVAAARAAHSPALTIVGAAWMQGETDALVLADANAYEANLRTFIAALRSHFGSSLPIIVGRISDSPVWTHGATVRAAQDAVDSVAVGGIAGVTTISTDDLTRAADDAHYVMSGLVTLGERFAAELQ